jgi:hypothetical protein
MVNFFFVFNMRRKSSLLQKEDLFFTPSEKQEIKSDFVYENERGTGYLDRKFSKKALLSADPYPYTDSSGNFVLSLESFRCGTGYEWCSDWIIDMCGQVDEEGWSYNTSFLDHAGWTFVNPNSVSTVRRRRWQRMRRQNNEKISSPVLSGLENLQYLMRQKKLDRERLKVMQEGIQSMDFLNANVAIELLNEFDYECTKREVAILLLKKSNETTVRNTVLFACLSSLLYTCDKLALLKSIDFPLDGYKQILVSLNNNHSFDNK